MFVLFIGLHFQKDKRKRERKLGMEEGGRKEEKRKEGSEEMEENEINSIWTRNFY